MLSRTSPAEAVVATVVGVAGVFVGADDPVIEVDMEAEVDGKDDEMGTDDAGPAAAHPDSADARARMLTLVHPDRPDIVRR